MQPKRGWGKLSNQRGLTGQRIGRGETMKIVEFRSADLEDAPAVREAVERLVDSGADCWLVPAVPESAAKLEAAGRKAQAQELLAALTLAEGARTFHNQMGRRLSEGENWRTTQTQLRQLFEEVTTLIHGIYLLGECTPQALRVLNYFAERAGVIAVASALRSRDVAAAPIWERVLVGEAAETSLKKLKLEVSERAEAGEIVLAPHSVGQILRI